jgi:SH3-like domain-containing protein
VHARSADIECRQIGPADFRFAGPCPKYVPMIRYAIPVLFVLGLVPLSAAKASVVPGEEHCVVNVAAGDRLNIRSGPSPKARVISRKRYGSCVIMVVGNCRAQWCPAEDGHSTGWASRRFLSMVSPSLYCTVGGVRQAAVHVRAFPSVQSRVLVALKRPTCGIAFLPFARGIWQKIRVNGWEGWVNRAHVIGQ